MEDKLLPSIVKKLSDLAETNPKSVRSIVQKLTPEARKEITHGVLANSMKKSTHATKGFNGEKFVQEVNKSNKLLGITMTKPQKQMSVGLKRMADAIQGRTKLSGAGDVATKIIGAGSVGFLTVFGGLGPAIAVGVSIKGISKVLSSPKVAQALVKLGSQNGSKAGTSKSLISVISAVDEVKRKERKNKNAR